jgi:hypothetical protein
MPTRRSLVVLAATIRLVAAAPARAQDRSIVVASTTSTQDSGLFGHILPLFKAKTGIVVNRDSPDESQTGINVRVFPDPLARQTRGADRYQHSGNPNACSRV